MNKKIVVLLIIITLLIAAWLLFGTKPGGSTLIGSALYSCDGGKSISAEFYENPNAEVAQPGEMPNPSGTAVISLDGGESMTLMQTISASGVRYANEDESFVFWNKGNEALIMRNNSMDLAYLNCRTESE